MLARGPSGHASQRHYLGRPLSEPRNTWLRITALASCLVVEARRGTGVIDVESLFGRWKGQPVKDGRLPKLRTKVVAEVGWRKDWIGPVVGVQASHQLILMGGERGHLQTSPLVLDECDVLRVARYYRARFLAERRRRAREKLGIERLERYAESDASIESLERLTESAELLVEESFPEDWEPE